MTLSPRAHRAALRALIDAPANLKAAEKVLVHGREDAEGLARAAIAIHPLPRAPLDLRPDPYDRNNLHQPTTPKAIVEPRDLDGMVAAVQAAASAGRPTRAIGDGWGMSRAAFTTGHMIVPVERLDRVLPIDKDLLRRASTEKRLLRFEAGATIEDLNEHFEKKEGNKRQLWNQPGFEHLTYAGVMSVGGHGSGLAIKGLAEYVRSIHSIVVDETGRAQQVQVEPKRGITHPAKFAEKHGEIALFQDDTLFYGLTVGLGSVGAIYSLTIEVRKGGFNILENRKRMKWSTAKRRLPGLLKKQRRGDLHSIELWLNPYEVKGEVWCVLGTREETRRRPKGQRGIGIRFFPKAFGYVIGWITAVAPRAIPCLMHAALGATEAEDVVMSPREGLNFGAPNSAPVDASAVGLHVDRTAESAEGLIVFFQNEAKLKGYVNSPVGFRFVKAADSFMSPQHGRDTCMVEIPILKGTPNALRTLSRARRFAMNKYGARPHWGQINDVNARDLQRLYPNLADFLQTYRTFNPRGFFDNALTEQLGLRQL